MRERGVEGVTADNLVQVGRGDGAGVDERVDTVDYELGALEAEHGGDVDGCWVEGGRFGLVAARGGHGGRGGGGEGGGEA